MPNLDVPGFVTPFCGRLSRALKRLAGDSQMTGARRAGVGGVMLLLIAPVQADEKPKDGLWARAFRDTEKGVAFATLGASQWSLHLGSGSKFAPFGSRDAPGFRMMVTSGTKFRERDPLVIGRFNRAEGGRILGGYEARFGSLTVSAFAGVSLSVASPYEQVLSRRASRLGGAILLETWQSWQSGQWLSSGFTAATLLVDSAEESAFIRLRHGFDLGFHGLALGPEISLSAGSERKSARLVARDSWLKTRAGLHLHGLRYGRLGATLSGGYEFRRGEKGSLYGEITPLWYY